MSNKILIRLKYGASGLVFVAVATAIALALAWCLFYAIDAMPLG